MEVSPVYLLLSAPGGAPFNTAAAFSFFTETTARHYSLHFTHHDFYFWWIRTPFFIILVIMGTFIIFVVKKIKLIDSFQTKVEILDNIWRKSYIASIYQLSLCPSRISYLKVYANILHLTQSIKARLELPKQGQL